MTISIEFIMALGLMAGAGATSAPAWSNDPAELPRLRRSWSEFGFSDPRRHDRRCFTYVVKMSRTAPTAEGVATFLAALDHHPSGSASLISDRFPNVFQRCRWGAVITIPPDRILATAPYDLNRQVPSSADLAELGLHTPAGLLFESQCAYALTPRRHARPDGAGTYQHADAVFCEWNEIAYGAPIDQPIEVQALILVPNVHGSIHGKQFDQPLRACAERLGLPLIKIPRRVPPWWRAVQAGRARAKRVQHRL